MFLKGLFYIKRDTQEYNKENPPRGPYLDPNSIKPTVVVDNIRHISDRLLDNINKLDDIRSY